MPLKDEVNKQDPNECVLQEIHLEHKETDGWKWNVKKQHTIQPLCIINLDGFVYTRLSAIQDK